MKQDVNCSKRKSGVGTKLMNSCSMQIKFNLNDPAYSGTHQHQDKEKAYDKTDI